MTAINPAKCSCQMEHHEFAHEKTCDLWLDDDFYWQLALWSVSQGELVPMPDDHELMDMDVASRWDRINKDLTESGMEPVDEDHIPLAVKAADSAGDIPFYANPKKKETPSVTPKNGIKQTGSAKKEPSEKEKEKQKQKEINDLRQDISDYEQYDAKYVENGGIIECFCAGAKNKYFCSLCGVERRHLASKWWRAVYRWTHEQKAGSQSNPPTYECTCKKGYKDKKVCSTCKVQRKDKNSPWTWYNVVTAPKNGVGGGTGYTYTPKCRHIQQAVDLPSGKIYCTSGMGNPTAEQAKEMFVPDLHVMLATSQKPVTLAWYLDWQDFGLPRIPDGQVLTCASEMLKYVKGGLKVEFGCAGGHGRTGCLLALIYLLDVGPHTTTGEKAVEWVRDKYCEEAIEGTQQEEYVEHMRKLMCGLESERPKPASVVKNGTKGSQVAGQKSFGQDWEGYY